MKNIAFLLTFFISISAFAQNVFISEINYEKGQKGFEITGPANINLGNYRIEYLKTDGKSYHAGQTPTISGTISNQSNGYGAIWFNFNLKKDGILVLIGPNDVVIQPIIAYGKKQPDDIVIGTASVTSKTNIIYIGEESKDPNSSLQRTSSGWVEATSSIGDINENLSTLSVRRDEIPGFNVYPNPVKNGKISISTNSFSNKFVTIYSILGSTVYQREIRANETIDVENLSTGLYFVQVEEEEKVSIKKIVIN